MTTLTRLNNFLNKTKTSFKYSNYSLFSRRETEYSSQTKQKTLANINFSIQRPYSSSIKKISIKKFSKKHNNKFNNSNNLNIFSENQSSVFSKKSSKSNAKSRIHVEDYFHKKNKSKTNETNITESILNLEKYYTPNINFNNKYLKTHSNLNINMKNYFNDLKYINQIYLTEANTKPKLKNNTITYNNFNFNDYKEHIYKDFSKNQNIDLLTKFKNDKLYYDHNETLKTEYNERIINNKRKRINLCREKKNEIMDKTRQEKFDKLALDSKKELFIRIQENYHNKVEYLDNRIESFETWKKLNRDFFENKIADYLKFLMYKKAYEKNKVEDLLEEIVKIKKESNKIYSKMAKIEIEKNKILRWVYFQIQLKEKKIVLPKYYKLILENINLIDNYYEIQLKKEKTSEIIQSFNNNNLSLRTPSPKKRDRFKRSIKKIISTKRIFPTINLDSELMAFLNKKEGRSEYLRIKEYKNNLIFKDAEDFHEGLLSLEKEDLRLIQYNDFIKEKIFWLKKELDKVIKEKNKMINIYNYNLRINLNELNQLKQRHIVLELIIKYLENNKNNIKFNNKQNIKNKKRNKSANIFSKRKEIKKADKKILYFKINKLFNICKLVKFNNQNDYEILEEKRKLLKNDEILYYFVYIEYCFNYLLTEINKFRKNHKNGEKIIKKIKFDIERNHRIEKAEEMRKQLREKYIKLEKEINIRNNKIYFLPYKKIRDTIKIKKEIIIVKDKVDEQPNFEDFIDEDNIKDNYSCENSEEEKY